MSLVYTVNIIPKDEIENWKSLLTGVCRSEAKVVEYILKYLLVVHDYELDANDKKISSIDMAIELFYKVIDHDQYYICVEKIKIDDIF